MASIIPGFEYDVFISYRHKDNKGDHWVTEFVAALKTELEATFKEDISIYFDANPVDGLLETHSVDKSLEGKLKCLIFIPILSQTYCDPNSFAWQHEFRAFIALARQDSYGLDIQLRNGNVASRVLPVKIHDLEDEDKSLLEKELGGFPRAIDFTFSAPGVSRPLTPTDKREENTGKTVYRDQINKVARGIKEVITGMQQPSKPAGSPPSASTKDISSSGRKKMGWLAAAFLLFGLISFSIFYFLDWGRKLSPVVDKSIAVLPFTNMSGDKDQDYFSDGMMDEILNQLAKIGELKVTSRTSSMLYKDSDKPLKEIASELGVSHLLEGSVQRSGNRVRIITQLIDAATDKHLWSETFDRDLTDVFAIQTEISKGIANQLNIVLSATDKMQLEYVPTTNQKAYDLYLKAAAAFDPGGGVYTPAFTLLDEAIKEDSLFALAYAKRGFFSALCFFNKGDNWEGMDRLAQADQKKAIQISPDAVDIKITSVYILYLTERKYKEALTLAMQLKAEYPNNAFLYAAMGAIQRRMGLFRESMESYNIALELDPGNATTKYEFYRLFESIREYDKARALLPQGQDVLLAFSFIMEGKLEKGFEILERTGDEYYLAYYKRDFKKILEIIDNSELEVASGESFYLPKALEKADVYFMMNDAGTARRFGEDAIAFLEKKVIKSPTDYRIHAALGLAYAHAGKPDKAIDSGNEARRLMPVTLDAFYEGPTMELHLAKIYLVLGNYDLCMDKLEYLLGIPGWFNISVGQCQADPFFDKLRDLPRFQKMMNTEYKTVY